MRRRVSASPVRYFGVAIDEPPAVAKEYPGEGYDLVAFFDCLHDLGDPVGASTHVLRSLAKDGTWMIVEPYANDRVEQNLNPIGRAFYAASTMIVGRATGMPAGEMLASLERLERLAIIRPAGDRTYDFGHDLAAHSRAVRRLRSCRTVHDPQEP